MAKNAQNTWVGTQAQPVFQTYQTAGMLQPAPTTAPVTPPPSPITPVIPPLDLGQIDFGGGGGFQLPGAMLPEVASIGMDDGRSRLANAIVGATMGKNLVRRAKF